MNRTILIYCMSFTVKVQIDHKKKIHLIIENKRLISIKYIR